MLRSEFNASSMDGLRTVDLSQVQGISWGCYSNPAVVCIVFETVNGACRFKLSKDRTSIDQAQNPDNDEVAAPTVPTPKDILLRLSNANLSTHLCYSDDRNYIFCFVGLGNKRMLKWADERAFDLKLDPQEALVYGRSKEINYMLAQNTALPGEDEVLVMKLQKFSEGQCTSYEEKFPRVSLDLWEDIYVKYSSKVPENIYHRYADGAIFSAKHKLQILDEIMRADQIFGGAGLKIEWMCKSQHPVCAVFAIDDLSKNKKLVPYGVFFKLWGKHWCNSLEDIRNYYGEKVAFYFAFLQFFTKALVLPAFVGIIFFCLQIHQRNVACDGIWVWILFLIFWNVIFVGNWRKYEASLKKKWGKLRFSEKAVPRPEFEGKMSICKITGLIVETELKQKRKAKQTISATTVFFWAFLAGIPIYYLLMTKTESKNTGYGILLGFLNAIVIQVFNVIYTNIANSLNHWENHRLAKGFDNNMILKKIVFQLMNSFAGLFFIGFFRPIYLGHTYESTISSDINKEVLNSLQVQLGALFVTLIVMQNTQELFMKRISKKFSKCMSGDVIPPTHTSLVELIQLTDDDLGDAFSSCNIFTLKENAEYQIDLPLPTTPMDNMSEMIIEEGYSTIFAIAFPLAPLLSVINNLIEFRVDMRNLEVSQRIIPHDASGVGLWGKVLYVLSFISVVSNWALFVYRTDQLTEAFGDDTRILNYFFGLGITLTSLAVWMLNRSLPSTWEHLERIKEIEKFLVFGGRKGDVAPGGNLYCYNDESAVTTIRGVLDHPWKNIESGHVTKSNTVHSEDPSHFSRENLIVNSLV